MAVATVKVLALLAMAKLVGAPAECDDQWPIMAASSAIQKSSSMMLSLYMDITAPYGEDLSLFCSANNINNLRIRDGRHYLETRQLNSTTIHYVMKKPNLGRYTYNCTSDSGCENSIWVSICPAINVNLPSVRRRQGGEENIKEYFVALGEQYEIICRGNENKSISIESSNRDGFQLKALNTTTVKYKALADRADTLPFWCISYDIACSSGIILVLDYYPEAQHFQCNFNDDQFECKWLSSSRSNTFTLFHKDKSGEMTLFCADLGNEVTRMCTWDSFSWQYDALKRFYDYSFLIRSCNPFVCDNKTLSTNRESVKILHSPFGLQVFNKSSHGDVVISWFHRYTEFIAGCVYKVEYRLLAMAWREAELSTVQCDYPGNKSSMEPDIKCKVKLYLPCPSSPYEIKLYFKLPEKKCTKRCPWSEPASLRISTPPLTGDTLNAECRAELKEPDRVNSADKALNKVAKLLSHFIEKNAELTKKISDLKKKRARVQALRELAADRT